MKSWKIGNLEKKKKKDKSCREQGFQELHPTFRLWYKQLVSEVIGLIGDGATVFSRLGQGLFTHSPQNTSWHSSTTTANDTEPQSFLADKINSNSK